MTTDPNKWTTPLIDDVVDPEKLAAMIGERKWLIGGYLMRSMVTIITGKGGFGKSTLALCIAVAVASGVHFQFWAPRSRENVLYVSAEDDKDEMQRRIIAICQRFGFDLDVVQRRLHLVVPTSDQGVVLFKWNAARNKIQNADLADTLPDIVANLKLGLIVVDPLVEVLQGVDENSNTMMAEAMAKFREMARDYDMPVLIVHHDRKGGVGESSIQDGARGASAIVNSARLVVSMLSGFADEKDWVKANKARTDEGLPQYPGSRHDYYLVAVGKSNYSRRGDAHLVRMESVQIPTGDRVGVPVPVDERIAASDPTPEKAKKNAAKDVAQGDMVF